MRRPDVARLDQFAGAGKVMSCFVPRLLARGLGAAHRLLEPAPLAVTEQRPQIARGSMFGATIVAALGTSNEGRVAGRERLVI